MYRGESEVQGLPHGTAVPDVCVWMCLSGLDEFGFGRRGFGAVSISFRLQGSGTRRELEAPGGGRAGEGEAQTVKVMLAKIFDVAPRLSGEFHTVNGTGAKTRRKAEATPGCRTKPSGVRRQQGTDEGEGVMRADGSERRSCLMGLLEESLASQGWQAGRGGREGEGGGGRWGGGHVFLDAPEEGLELVVWKLALCSCCRGEGASCHEWTATPGGSGHACTGKVGEARQGENTEMGARRASHATCTAPHVVQHKVREAVPPRSSTIDCWGAASAPSLYSG